MCVCGRGKETERERARDMRPRNKIVSSAALDRGFTAWGEPNPVWARNLILIIISHEPSQSLPHFCCVILQHTPTPPPTVPADLTSLRCFKKDYSTFITSSEVPLLTQGWQRLPSRPAHYNHLWPLCRSSRVPGINKHKTKHAMSWKCALVHKTCAKCC